MINIDDEDILPDIRHLSHMIDFLDYQSEYLMKYGRFDLMGSDMYFKALDVRNAVIALRTEYSRSLKFQLEMFH